MIIGQFCETYPPALDGVGRVMLAYCQTLQSMGHRCLYVAPRDAAHTYPVQYLHERSPFNTEFNAIIPKFPYARKARACAKRCGWVY